MDQEIENMKSMINNLKIRKSMFIVDTSYSSLVSFLIGYNFAIKKLNGSDFSAKFKDWLSIKYKTHFAVHWSGYILSQLSDGNEEIAERTLFALFEEFLKERESGG